MPDQPVDGIQIDNRNVTIPQGSPNLNKPITREEFNKLTMQVQQLIQINGGYYGSGGSVDSGSGVPNYAAALGTLYIRTDGAPNTLYYICEGGNSWTPVLDTVSIPTTIPAYNKTGGGISPHIVVGTVSINASSTATVTLSGAAVFTSGTSYSVAVSSDAAAQLSATAYAQTGSTFKIDNPAGGGAGASDFNWMAIGT